MANCHTLFATDFNSIIRLNDSKRKSLKKSRKALRDRIRKYFRENKPYELQPKFSSQGSMVIDTIIEPIPRKEKIDGKEQTVLYYDVDDGVYFIGNQFDRKAVQTYHNWIREAVDGHTAIPAKDKNTCVRTLFADGHNIDHPIYFKDGSVPELAHMAKGFTQSDPKAFRDWFEVQVKDKPQLRRLVRYIKAWCDYRKFTRPDQKLPSGFIMTILTCQNYYAHDRDDIALKETLVLIKDALRRNFTCYRPTIDTTENLLIEYWNHRVSLIEQLGVFITNGNAALEERNHKKACGHWQKSFGDRFPCQNAKDEDENLSSVYLSSVASNSRPYAQ
ncbi:MAG: CBASS cGAMP synthase [Bacteroidota bacterium]